MEDETMKKPIVIIVREKIPMKEQKK